MRKIDKLLLHAVIPPFLISLTVLTFVFFIQQIGSLSKLLITKNASFEIVLGIAGTILPGILIFSLPLAYLIGILIGLSGLAGESQITALRACGVPHRKLIRAILILGFIVGCISFFISTTVIPQTNDKFRQLKSRISLRGATSQIKPRVFNEEYEDYSNIVFYLDDFSLDQQRWSRVFLADNSDRKIPRIYIAKSGSWITDSLNQRLQLHLEDGAIYSIETDNPDKNQSSSFSAMDVSIEVNRGSNAMNENNHNAKKVSEQNTWLLLANYSKYKRDGNIEPLVELHKRIALPFSILSFAFLGLALGGSVKKGGRTSGFAFSLATVLLFYILFSNGIRLASVGTLSPWVGAWNANILLGVFGLWLMIHADRSVGKNRLFNLFWNSRLASLCRRFQFERIRSAIDRFDRAIIRSTRGLAKFHFPKVFDFYISRWFLVYFLWSFITCGALFVLFTLFDLLDDIIRNRIAVSYVVEYFTFLSPRILMIVVPMSVLLAILINFGILEKNSEITAIKAGGWSLYRIAIPIFLMAACLSIGLFLMQDYILPYANTRQDYLRNIIKGKAQTSMRLQRKWILGESSRIYNYKYFDGQHDSFVDLNIYEIDFNSARILKFIHAASAFIDEHGEWTLKNGWIRDYRTAYSGLLRIESTRLYFPERASYFKKEIFQPKESEKLTYAKLKNYIKDLNKSGYNATELQVELNKKISFPLSCLTMALIGIPFSFSTGKKGAFFGIGVSIAIAISYWGIAGVFEAMGSYGLLLPILAAWAPNILFGALGLALLFTIRT